MVWIGYHCVERGHGSQCVAVSRKAAPLARDLFDAARDGSDANLLGLDQMLKRWLQSGHVTAPRWIIPGLIVLILASSPLPSLWAGPLPMFDLFGSVPLIAIKAPKKSLIRQVRHNFEFRK
jgi:hypothetical protein